MKKLIFVLTISVLCVSGCLSGSGYYQADYDFGNIDKIAVIAVEGQVQNESAKNQISNLFVMELLNKGYAPIPLAQAKAKIQEMVDTAEIPEPAQDAYLQMGKALKVPAILMINIPYFNEEISIDAQLINTTEGNVLYGSVLWMDRDSGPSGVSDIDTPSYGPSKEDYLMDPLLMSQGPFGASQDQEMPLAPGQRPLNPHEELKIQYVVSKICSSLPSHQTNTTVSGTTARPRTTSDW